MEHKLHNEAGSLLIITLQLKMNARREKKVNLTNKI